MVNLPLAKREHQHFFPQGVEIISHQEKSFAGPGFEAEFKSLFEKAFGSPRKA